MVELDETGADRSITIHIGDHVRVCLAENPTTGYRWRLAQDHGAILTLMHNQASAPAADPAGTPTRPGASGLHTWLFQAHSAGDAELRFESARSWEPAATGKTIVFPIAVKSPHT